MALPDWVNGHSIVYGYPTGTIHILSSSGALKNNSKSSHFLWRGEKLLNFRWPRLYYCNIYTGHWIRLWDLCLWHRSKGGLVDGNRPVSIKLNINWCLPNKLNWQRNALNAELLNTMWRRKKVVTLVRRKVTISVFCFFIMKIMK